MKNKYHWLKLNAFELKMDFICENCHENGEVKAQYKNTNSNRFPFYVCKECYDRITKSEAIK